MSRLLVALDLDGVCHEFGLRARKLLREVYGEDPGPGPCQKWDAIKHSVSKEAWTWLWEEGPKHGLFAGPPTPGTLEAVEAMKQLYNVGVVTARPRSAESDTARFCDGLGVGWNRVDELRDKVALDFDVFIEDAPDAIEAMRRAEKRVIVFDQPWNREVRPGTFVYRAKSWDDVLEVLDRIAKERLSPVCAALPKLNVPNTSEERVTDPDTGAQKGRKLERFDLVPAEALEEVARAYGHGSTKYADRNWERGYAWSLSFGAMQRHAWAFWRGEDADPESDLPHMAHVAWHALALMTFARTNREKDDRP